jgi:hypothetical protein
LAYGGSRECLINRPAPEAALLENPALWAYRIIEIAEEVLKKSFRRVVVSL